MTLEERVAKLEKQFANFNRAYLQSQKNQTSVTSKVDTTSNNVETLTPYTETKTAYIGETEIFFYTNVVGNLSVFLNNNVPFHVERTSRIEVHFDEPLEEVTEVTISIQ